MARTLSPDAIANATGCTWNDWRHYFDSLGAKHLTHQEIVAKAVERGAAPWWCQMITVTYEQHIGRRVPGQDCDGAFALSASRTVSDSLDDAFKLWLKSVEGATEFSGVAVNRKPSTSRSEKWRYWRCGLADGSRVIVNICAKPPLKSIVNVQHEKLESADVVNHWREYWKAKLHSL